MLNPETAYKPVGLPIVRTKTGSYTVDPSLFENDVVVTSAVRPLVTVKRSEHFCADFFMQDGNQENIAEGILHFYDSGILWRLRRDVKTDIWRATHRSWSTVCLHPLLASGVSDSFSGCSLGKVSAMSSCGHHLSTDFSRSSLSPTCF